MSMIYIIRQIVLLIALSAGALLAAVGGFNQNKNQQTPLVAPELTFVSELSPGNVLLTWNDTNSSETGYVVERSTSATGAFSQITSLPTNSVSYTDTSLSSGQYSYRVAAIGRKSIKSAYSNIVSITTTPTAGDTTSPNVTITSPSNGSSYTDKQTVTFSISATDNTGVTKLELLKDDSIVYTSTTPGSTYSYDWPITSSDNGTHTWIAKAYDADGNSGVSSAVSVTVNITAIILPPTAGLRTGELDPAGFSISDINTGSAIKTLHDNNTSTGATLSPASKNPGINIDMGETKLVDRVYFTGTDNVFHGEWSTTYSTPPLGRIVVWVGNSTTTQTMTRAGEFMVPYDQTSPISLEGDIRFSPIAGRYVHIELENSSAFPAEWWTWGTSPSYTSTSGVTTYPWKISELELYGFSGSNVTLKQDAVVLPPNADKALSLAALELSYYLGKLEGKPVPIVISSNISSVATTYPGTLYNVMDLSPLAPDWNTMITNQNNGSLPTKINIIKNGNRVDFRAWPHRNVLESVWEFLRRQGITWVYPTSHGDYIPTTGVNLSLLPISFSQLYTYANWPANSFQPWSESVNQTIRQDYLYAWRNGWTSTFNMLKIFGGDEIPTKPSTGIALASEFSEGFSGYPHNLKNVVPQRILNANPTWCGFVISSNSRICSDEGQPAFDMTNPDLINWITDKMIAVETSNPIDKNPVHGNEFMKQLYQLLPQDFSQFDQSTNSIALNKPDESNDLAWVRIYPKSQSGVFYDFVNKIATKVKALNPDITIGVLNYADIFLPPPNISRLPDNINVELVQYGSPNLPMDSIGNAEFKRVIDTWTTKASHFTNYDYVLLHTDYWQQNSSFPAPMVAGIISRARYLKSIGALTGGTQASTLSFPYNPWNFYAYTRIRQDTSLSEDQILNEFFRAYFSESAVPMLAYYHDMEDWQVQNNVDLFYYGYAVGITPGSFPIAVLAKMQNHLASAEAMATNWETKKRIAYIREGYDFVINSLKLSGINLNDTSRYVSVGSNTNPVVLDLSKGFRLQMPPSENNAFIDSDPPVWNMAPYKGSLSIPVYFTQGGTYTITVNAYNPAHSIEVNPIAKTKLYVGPKLAGTISVSTTTPTDFSFNVTIPSGYGVQDIEMTTLGQFWTVVKSIKISRQ